MFTANHDHVGNTPAGLGRRTTASQRLVAAAAVLLSPFTPLLFMGEEYGEPAPFPFFVDYGSEELLEATRAGRRHEFRDSWTEEVADPADPATFAGAVLTPSLADGEPHRDGARRLHRAARGCGGSVGVLRGEAEHVVTQHGDAVVVDRRRGDERSLLVLGFGDAPTVLRIDTAGLRIVFDSAAPEWGGDGMTSVLDDGSLAIGPVTAVLLTGSSRIGVVSTARSASAERATLTKHVWPQTTPMGEDDGGEGGERGVDGEGALGLGLAVEEDVVPAAGRELDRPGSVGRRGTIVTRTGSPAGSVRAKAIRSGPASIGT